MTACDPKQLFEYLRFWWYRMNARTWKLAAIVGLLVGLVVSAVMTIVDWRLHPAGVFYDESGTAWTIVTETALSWLGPVALVTFLATVIVLYLIAWIRRS